MTKTRRIKPVEYKDQRETIKTGDLITVHFSKGWFWKIVNLIISTGRNHSGLALWCGDTLFIAEQNPQAPALIRLSQYMSRVYYIEITPFPHAFFGSTEESVRAAIYRAMRVRIRYSKWQLIVAGLDRLTRITLPYSQNKQICSQWVLLILRYLGFIIPQKTEIVDPDELVLLFEELGNED